MRNQISKLTSWCKSHKQILIINATVVGVVVAIAVIIWFCAGERTTFGPLNQYGFLWFSILIASIAAINAILALTVTRQSLELTRETQRPFLDVSGCTPIWSHNTGNQTTVNYFVVQISNTGVFPADNVSVLFNISDINDSNKKHLLALRKDIPSICFPNDGISNLIFEELAEGNKLTIQEGGKIKAQIEIRYENKLMHRSHKTIRSYLAQDISSENRIIPLPEGDYWD